VTISGANALSGGSGILTGSQNEDSDKYTISKSGDALLVKVDNMEFFGLLSVSASGASDTIVGTDSLSGESWVLGSNDGDITLADIEFSGVEKVSADKVAVDAATNDRADIFELSKSGQAMIVRGITFSSVSQVSAGIGSGDKVISDATAWQLGGVDGELAVNDVQFTGIDMVETTDAQLFGTDEDDTFELTETGLESAGIAFSGVNEVIGYEGADKLIGTEGADQFALSSEGDISVAGIKFTGLKILDAAGGNDTVIADGATWTSSISGSSLEKNAAEATVNNITVAFDNLELVQGAGIYVGQDVGSNYVFSSLDTMTVAGVTFADLESLTAGAGEDSVYGADIDAKWDITASKNTVTSGRESLLFSGIEFIYAGSGADTFNLTGGELTAIDSGAGDDTVILSNAVIDRISLGEGDDYVQVDAESGQQVELYGGGGNDSFQYNLAGDTWQIYSAGNSVGNFQFTDFEFLDNTADSISLETDLSFDFVNGGDYSSAFNNSGAGLVFHANGMRLGYDGNGDISVVSSASETIGGVLKANRADIVASGDVNIETDVNVLAISTSGPNIDITVLAQEDLIIDEINAGRGNVQLASAGFGVLTAETYGDTHITAGSISLGTDTQLWSIIGSELTPLRMDANGSVEIVSVSYYEPEFIGQVPNFTSKGDELQSIAGAQAAQGLRSAVQNGVEDFTLVDPAIFSAVKPYSSGVDAVNSPEMRLRSGELSPAEGFSGAEEEHPDFDAMLEAGEDITIDMREQEVMASNNAGG
ncbi:hypothetical protein, partial [Microbulbifer epialgicus]